MSFAKGTVFVLALWAAACPAVWSAQSSSSLTLSNVQFQLVDLDPRDGIAPSIQLEDPINSTFVFAYVTQPGGIVTAGTTQSGHTGQAVSATANESDGAASAQVFAGDVFSAPGPIAQVSSSFSGVAGGNAASEGQVINVTFVLSPHTKVIVTATGTVGDGNSTHTALVDWDATAAVDLAISGPLGGRPGPDDDSLYAYWHDGQPVAISGDAEMHVSLTNFQSTPLDGFVSAVAYSASSAVLVPEPSSAVLFMLGLGAIVALRTRPSNPPEMGVRCRQI